MAASDRKVDRRDFLRRVGAGVGLGCAFPTIIPARAFGANERIRLGHIGVGRQGTLLLGAFLKINDAESVAVCDVDSTHLAAAKAQVEKAGRSCAAHGDYRRLLDAKDVDAVVIATPDHWHALPTIDACAAGKDVYTEKPLTLTVREGQAMVQAARRHGRVVQTGSQQRSDEKFRLACELVRNGRLGQVPTVRVALPEVNFPVPGVPDTDPPPELDYDFWLGPAPKRPYNPKRSHYNFKFFWDYGGGQVTNWGAHHLDIVQWALGRDESGPATVEGHGQFNKEGWYEVPETSEIVFTYDDGVKVLCEQGKSGTDSGVTFEGEQGTLFVTRGTIRADPAEILERPLSADDVRLYASADHYKDWFDCIRSRERPICDVAIGHRSATVCHLGNLSIRLDRKLTWDPKTETIVDDAEAAGMLGRPYRAPWRLPEVVRVEAPG